MEKFKAFVLVALNKEIKLIRGSLLILSVLIVGCQPSTNDFVDNSVPSERCEQLIQSVGINEAYKICLKDAKKNIPQAQFALAKAHLQSSLINSDSEKGLQLLKKASDAQFYPAQLFLSDYYFKQKKPTLAVETLTRAANQGNTDAQLALANIYMEGKFVKQNVLKARHILEQAVELGAIEAQYQLYESYQIQGYQNTEKSIVHLESAAKQNHLKSMETLADHYIQNGHYKSAAKWLAKGARLGSLKSNYLLAKLTLDNKLPWSLDVVELLHRSIDYPASKVLLAKCYQTNLKVKQNTEKAKKLLIEASQQGDPQADYEVGVALLKGVNGWDKNKDVAIEYLKRSAAKGYQNAKIVLATLFIEGQPIIEDKKELVMNLSIMAAGGNREAQYKLASVLKDFAIPLYDRIAYYWLKKAASLGTTEVRSLLAYFYEEGIGIEIDFPKALQLYQQVALEGYTPAYLSLAKFYQRGWGTLQDLPKARFWLQKAMQNNIEGAQELAHEVFEDGMGIEIDENASSQLLTYAVDSNVPAANFIQGKRYLEGSARYPKDSQYGIDLIKKAANQSYVLAQREMGIIYENGLHGQNNLEKAFYWYEKAALKGDAFSQFRLAEMYFHHKPNQSDKVKAYAWANLAASSGMAPAENLRDVIFYQLNPKEIERGQALSLQYLNHYQNIEPFYDAPMTASEEENAFYN